VKVNDRIPPAVVRGVFVERAESFDVETRTISHVISRESSDRAGDIVRVAGWDFRNFEKNPVVMWAHDYARPPIGTNKGLSIVGKNVKAKTQFDVADFAQEIAGLYERDVMRAWSVGFRPRAWEPILDDREMILGFEYTDQELLEYSAVPIGMHPDALGNAVKNGLVRLTLNELKAFLPQPEATPDPAVTPEQTREVFDRLGKIEVSLRLSTLRTLLRGERRGP
jgi:hypothetical protein